MGAISELFPVETVSGHLTTVTTNNCVETGQKPESHLPPLFSTAKNSTLSSPALHVCASQWIDTIQPETATPHSPKEHNSFDVVLSRFPNQLTGGTYTEGTGKPRLPRQPGPDEATPTGYQTVDNAHDNQIPELEAEHGYGQDA